LLRLGKGFFKHGACTLTKMLTMCAPVLIRKVFCCHDKSMTILKDYLKKFTFI
jgi:hypothetical protein